jgi:hypothetical protein
MQRRPGDIVKFQKIMVAQSREIAKSAAAQTIQLLQSVREVRTVAIAGDKLMESNVAGDAVSALDPLT